MSGIRRKRAVSIRGDGITMVIEAWVSDDIAEKISDEEWNNTIPKHLEKGALELIDYIRRRS